MNPMIHHLLFSLFIVALLPASAAALELTDATDRYRDAPFPPAETAGISVLTHVGAVEGNPDGTFAPGRGLNRAEFLKIATRSASFLQVTPGDCFPDVTADAWFSAFVCGAKERGVVQGYPDGRFHPERPVNYAEALKILYELHWGDQRALAPDAGEEWYVPYAAWAREEGVTLPGSVPVDALLTRGQMARLAAAYRAHAEGQLQAYRAFERGEAASAASVASSSSLSSASSASSASLSSSLPLSPSSSPSSVASLPPSVSHLLFPGQRTPVLMDGVFRPQDEDALVRAVTVEVQRKIAAVDAFVLVDALDRELAVLTPRSSGTQTERDTEWTGEPEGIAVLLHRGEATRLGLRARMKTGEEFVSGDIIEFRSLRLRLEGGASGNTQTWSATDTHLPVHQTVRAAIAGMENVLATSMAVQQGPRRLLASFQLSATGAAVQLKRLTFALDARDVTLTRVMIGGSTVVQQAECGLGRQGDAVTVNCPLLPEGFRAVRPEEPLTLSLHADLALAPAASAGFVQLRPLGRGSYGSVGTLQWSDGAADFDWVGGETALDAGPMVTVTK